MQAGMMVAAKAGQDGQVDEVCTDRGIGSTASDNSAESTGSTVNCKSSDMVMYACSHFMPMAAAGAFVIPSSRPVTDSMHLPHD